jgi:putative ABC transport system substrate-binding protein
MRRRELMLIVGGAATIWPFAGHAQQKAMPIIGLLSPLTPADTEPWHRAFRQGLGDLGWAPGANLRLELS